MQDWRHHQILGANGALAEILRSDGDRVFLKLLPGSSRAEQAENSR